MATQAQYTAGTGAAIKVLQADLTHLVPAWVQGWIPPNEAALLAPAIAQAVVDAVIPPVVSPAQGTK
jgi:hypothetical protein